MDEKNFRLYVGSKLLHYSTIDEVKATAKPFLLKKFELRIEQLTEIGLNAADWWAYNYETKRWEPS